MRSRHASPIGCVASGGGGDYALAISARGSRSTVSGAHWKQHPQPTGGSLLISSYCSTAEASRDD